MDAGTLIGLLVTLGSLVVSAVFTIVIVAVSVIVPLAIMGLVAFVIVKQLQSGNAQFVVASPLLAVAHEVANPSKPSPKRLKKVSCSQCGGSKVTPPKTAYVYCDYCGSFVDWDFQIACRTAGSAKPGPAYEALQRNEAPVQLKAKAAGDRETFAASTRRVFDAHFGAAKGSWSPRLGDPEYRAAMLDYTVGSYTLAAFDPDCIVKESAMNEAVKRLTWTPGFQPKVGRASFDALLATVIAHTDRFVEVSKPLLDNHPDGVTADLQRRISRSAFAQGWMSFLDKAGQDAMIAELGLGGDYVDVPTVETTERHCGGCSRTLAVAKGAKKVVCEDCGHTNDVAHPEITCTGCGGPVSVLWSKRTFQCPSCSTELRVDG